MRRAVGSSFSNADGEIARFTKDFETLHKNFDTGIILLLAKMNEKSFADLERDLNKMNENITSRFEIGQLLEYLLFRAANDAKLFFRVFELTQNCSWVGFYSDMSSEHSHVRSVRYTRMGIRAPNFRLAVERPVVPDWRCRIRKDVNRQFPRNVVHRARLLRIRVFLRSHHR